MIDPSAPPDIVVLAEERALARLERDFTRADELKTRIEAAGWRVVDDGPAFTLEPSRTPDLVEAGQVIYGSLDSVPRVATEAGATSVVVVCTEPCEPTLEAVAAHRPDGTGIVVVAPRGLEISGPFDELVRTVDPWSAGDALEAGIRRAPGAVIVVLDPGRIPTGDVVSPLFDALADQSVGIVGVEGLGSADLHRYQPLDATEVTTVASGCYAFRRDDLGPRGPVDGRLRLGSSVAVWLGLLLRDEGPDVPPRRALVVEAPLPTAPEQAGVREETRAARRDGYRISDRYREHTWLGGEQPPQGRLVGDGAGDHDRDDDPHQPADADEAQ